MNAVENFAADVKSQFRSEENTVKRKARKSSGRQGRNFVNNPVNRSFNKNIKRIFDN
jgi:hypothetical protein